MKIKFPQSHKTEIAIGGRVLDCFATPLREAEQVISISHWGMCVISYWLTEGPVYADRLDGRLTFLDWDNWSAEDQMVYQVRYGESIS